MAIIRQFYCYNCLMPIEFEDGSNDSMCIYCDHLNKKEAEPAVKDLLEKGSRYRNDGMFDSAEQIYDELIKQNQDNIQARWGRILSKYGVIYVEDKENACKRVVTCRKRVKSNILEDTDYYYLKEHADPEEYKNDVNTIAEIQKKIVKYNDYNCNIFICYKETDDNRIRTNDSVYAELIYQHLINDGYKVFFAHETLSDKFGADYEAMIFHAIESAQVMIVLGTKKEYFTSTWVKSEWSRYLELIRKGSNKTIIPMVMSSSDLPDELDKYQAVGIAKKDKWGFDLDYDDDFFLLRFKINKLLKDTSGIRTIDNRDYSIIRKDLVDEGHRLLLDGNQEEAIKCFKQAESEGNDIAAFMLGSIAYLDGDYKKAFSYFKTAAFKENKEAQKQLGFMYEYGVGVNENKKNGDYWTRISEGKDY